MTTYKRVTHSEIIEMIARLQNPCCIEIMKRILEKRLTKDTNHSRLVKEFRRRTKLDILHATGDKYLIRYVY